MSSYCAPGTFMTFPLSSIYSLFFWRMNRSKNLVRIRSVVRKSTLLPLSVVARIFGIKSAATSSGWAASTPKGNLRSSGVESSRSSFVKTLSLYGYIIILWYYYIIILSYYYILIPQTDFICRGSGGFDREPLSMFPHCLGGCRIDFVARRSW